MGATVSLRRSEHLRVWSGRRAIAVGDPFWSQMLRSFGKQPLVLGANVKESEARECIEEIFFILYRNDQATKNFAALIQQVCYLLRTLLFPHTSSSATFISSFASSPPASATASPPSDLSSSPLQHHSPLLHASSLPTLLGAASQSLSATRSSSPSLSSSSSSSSSFWQEAVSERLAATTDGQRYADDVVVEILNGLFFVRLFSREFIVSSSNVSQRRLLAHFGAAGNDHSHIVELLRAVVASLIVVSTATPALCELRLSVSLLELLLLLLSAGVGATWGETVLPNVFKYHLLNDEQLRQLAPSLVHRLLSNVAATSSSSSLNTADLERNSALSLSVLTLLFSAESSCSCCYRAALSSWAWTSGGTTSSLKASVNSVDTDRHESMFAAFVSMLAASTDQLLARRPALPDGGSSGGTGGQLTALEGTFGLQALFFYYVLYSNAGFRRHVLNRTDIELLVVPLLRYLYAAQLSDAELPVVITVCILLLLLTRQSPVNRMASQTRLASVPWYSFRYLVDISLLDLMVLVLLKTALRNLSSAKNAFVQQLCTGVLLNQAKYVVALHPAVADQLVSAVLLLLPRTDRHPLIAALLDALLDVLNVLVFFALSSSSSLVYCLLHRREQFDAHGAAQPRLHNVTVCIDHFVALLHEQRALDDPSADDTAAILDVIERGLRSWKPACLSPDDVEPVRCAFVEDDDADEFFHPFAWCLVVAVGGLLLAMSDASQQLEAA